MMMLTNKIHPSHAVALAVKGAGDAECAGGCRVTVREGWSAAMTGTLSGFLARAFRLLADGHRVLLVSVRLPGRAEPAGCARPGASSGRDDRIRAAGSVRSGDAIHSSGMRFGRWFVAD
jgi:hypothetical protein